MDHSRTNATTELHKGRLKTGLVPILAAVFTGLGYSLVYPGFGVEAVRSAPAQSPGLAMGAYTAFLDVALGLGTLALGLLGDFAGLGTVFLASMIAALGAASIAVAILYTNRRRRISAALAHS